MSQQQNAFPIEAEPVQPAENLPDVPSLYTCETFFQYFPIEYRNIWMHCNRFTRLIFLFRVVNVLSQIVTGIAIYIITANQQCTTVMRACFLIYLVLLFYILFLSPRYLSTAIPNPHEDPLITRREAIRSLAKSRIDLIFFIPFFIINIHLFDGRYSIYYLISSGSADICLKNAPAMYWLSVVYLIFGYMYIFFPIVVAVMVCLCLPCIMVLVHRRSLQQNTIFAQGMGATQEVINSLPIYLYRKKTTMSPADVEAQQTPSQSNSTKEPRNEVLNIIDKSKKLITNNVKQKSSKKRLRFPLFFRNNNEDESPKISPLDQQNMNEIENRSLEIESDDAVCSICLVEYEEGEQLRQLNCLHHFHVVCIDQWLKLKADCPLCVTSIKTIPDELRADSTGSQTAGPSSG